MPQAGAQIAVAMTIGVLLIAGSENHPRRQFHLVQPLPEVLGEPFLGLAERRRSACVAVDRADSREMLL